MVYRCFWVALGTLAALAVALVYILWGFQGPRRMGRLETGFILESSLAMEDDHLFTASMNTGDALYLVVDQKGSDIVLALLDPEDRPLFDVDELGSGEGREYLWFTAPREGAYAVKLTAGSGRERIDGYRFEVKNLGPASEKEAAYAVAFATRIKAGIVMHRPAEVFEEALDRWRELGDPIQEAITWDRYARYCDRTADYREAAAHWECAASLFRGFGDYRRAVLTYRDLTRCYEKLGEPDKAQRVCEMVLDMAEHQRDLELTEETYRIFGNLYYEFGQLQRAIELYGRALVLARTSNDRVEEANTLAWMGLCYSRLGRPKIARDHLRRTRNICQELQLTELEARVITELGWTWYLQQDYERAVGLYQNAIVMAREVGVVGAIAGAYDRKGSALREMDRFDDALDVYSASLKLLKGELGRKAHVWVNMAEVYEKMGRFDDAVAASRQALVVFEEKGEKLNAANAHFVLARAYRQLEQWDLSLEHITESIGVLDKIREHTTNPAATRAFFGSRHGYHQLYLELLIDLHEKRPERNLHVKAFELLEENRARSLRERLAERSARNFVEPQLLIEEREILDAINRNEVQRLAMLDGASDNRALDEVGLTIRDLLIRYEKIHTRILKQRRVGVEATPKVKLEVIQQDLLDRETVLLSYNLGVERSFLWEIDRDSCRLHILPGREGIELQARNLCQLLAAPEKRVDGAQRTELTKSLSQILLAPAEGRLIDKRLVFIKDGGLHRLPFAVLSDPVSGAPLIQEHELVALPSASYGVQLRSVSEKQKPAPMIAAVFGDPIYQNDDPRFSQGGVVVHAESPELRGVKELGLKSFRRLPFSLEEVKKILELVPGDRAFGALGFEASRERVTAMDFSEYRLVHFATHALLHPRHPELSGIVLSLFDHKGVSVDGFLRVHELENLEMPVELVTLSGCKTALGEEVPGEGVYGMGRVLMGTGAARVLASLWSVDDRATSIFMEFFYHFLLAEKLPPADALRRTQRAMMESDTFHSPYFWASFELQGDWRAFLE